MTLGVSLLCAYLLGANQLGRQRHCRKAGICRPSAPHPPSWHPHQLLRVQQSSYGASVFQPKEPVGVGASQALGISWTQICLFTDSRSPVRWFQFHGFLRKFTFPLLLALHSGKDFHWKIPEISTQKSYTPGTSSCSMPTGIQHNPTYTLNPSNNPPSLLPIRKGNYWAFQPWLKKIYWQSEMYPPDLKSPFYISIHFLLRSY